MNCIDRLFRKARRKINPFAPIVFKLSEYKTTWETRILAIINENRAKRGLDLLYPELNCQSVAEKRVERMVEINGTGHSMLAYDSKVLRKHGLTVAELQSYQYSDPKSVVNGWKASESHSKVLFGDYKYVGIGFDTYTIFEDGYKETIEFCSLILTKG